MRRARFVLLAVALAVVLTGCYRSDVGVKVNDDGSGTVDIILAIDPEQLQQLADQFGEDTGFSDDPCADIRSQTEDTSDLPEGSEVEPYDEDGYCGAHLTTPFPAGTDIGSFLLDELGFASDGETPTTFDSFVIERDGDGWRFEATTGSADTAGIDTGMLSGFLSGASSKVRITLPGEVVEENADSVEDGALVWDLDLLGGSRTLSARTEPGGDGGGSNALWIILGLVAVAAVVVGVVLWRRNAGRRPPSAPAPATVGASSGPPLAPPAAAPATEPAPAATGGPQWDAQRGAYIQWDPAGNRWMQFDDATQEWKPIPGAGTT